MRVLRAHKIMLLLVIVFMAICGNVHNVYAARDGEAKKFSSDAAKEHLRRSYVESCSKQYMGQFDVSVLTPDKLAGFQAHATQSCECMYKRVRMEFSGDQIADITKACCVKVDELITKDKDIHYFEGLQKRYLDFVFKRGYTNECGFVLDGVHINEPKHDGEIRVQ